jgi:uncharacterized membrane protein
MDWTIWSGLLLTLLPGAESRMGLPAIIYSVLKEGGSIWPWFFLVVILNSLLVLVIFFFLEFIHHRLEGWKLYHKTAGRFIEKHKKTAEKVQEKMHNLGYIALALFVAIPFTGTGAYTATTVAWILGLSKRKSFIAISIGVFFASLITLYITLFALGLIN